MLPRIGWGLVALVITFVQLAAAATVSVDDADPGITYSSASDWNIGNTCSACLAQPTDLSTINKQTWHDATRGPNSTEIWFEYSFQGTSLTVYGILVNVVITEYLFTTNTDLTITVDGESYTYTHAPSNTNSYQNQVPVFSKQGMSNTAHTARVTLNPSSAFLFDYLVYTTADTTSSATTSSAGASVSQTTSSATTSTGLTSGSAATSSRRSSSTSLSSLSAVGSISLSIDSAGTTHTIVTNIGSISSNSSTPPLRMILGIVGGVVGLLLIAICILIFLLCRKRRKSRQNMGPQALPSSASTGDHVSDPLMESAGPLSAFPHMFPSSTSEFNLHNASATTPFGSSNNLSSPNGSNDAAVAAAAGATTMNSKQRRMQQEQVYFPAQQSQQQHLDAPAWVTGGGGGGGTVYSRGGGGGGGSAIESSVYGGMDGMSSHTGPMTDSSGSTNYDPSDNTPLSRRVAPGVGGRVAPWNTGLYAHGIPAPVSLVSPMPVPLGVPLGHSEGSDGRISGASGVTRPPTAPPPYIRSPPPLLSGAERGSGGHGRRLGSVSEYDDEKR